MIDVIIAGAGPAGTTLARLLGRKGLKVLILDKRKFPRNKVCGGGVTARTLTWFDFDLNSCIEDKINKMTFCYRNHAPLTVSSAEPFIYMVMRERFDMCLLEHAVASGASFVEGKTVTGCLDGNGHVEVITDSSKYQSHLVIGADGAHSVIAKSLQIRPVKKWGVGLEAEISLRPDEIDRFRGQIYLNYGSLPFGYGWIFPKTDHLSLGVGSFRPQRAGKISPYLEAHAREFAIPLSAKAQAHPLPTCHPAATWHSRRVLLLGDAAGLVDPFTGEGIHNAVRSAQLAAGLIPDILDGKSPADEYTEAVRREILPELQEAVRLANLIYRFPHAVHHLIKAHPSVLERLHQLISGALTYGEFNSYVRRKLSLFRLLQLHFLR